MKKSKTSALILILLVFAFPKDLLSQEIIPAEYIVITYELSRTKDSHGVRNFYWIVSVDSLKDKRALLSPIYFTGFAKNHFNMCCRSEMVDIFTTTTSSTYDFVEGYEKSVEELTKMVYKQRKKLQTITKEWAGGSKETIRIYATPVLGEFCHCKITKEDGGKIDYNGTIYLPLGNFSISNGFWNSKNAPSILNRDFTRASIATSPFMRP